MNPKRLIVLLILVALAIGAFATRGFGLLGTTEAARLTLYGNVDIREVELAFRVGGQIEAIPVEEGERVEEGDVLAQLDTRPLEDRIAAAQAQVASAQAELAKRRAGNRPQEIEEARAQLEGARAELVRSREDLERRRPLAETGAISEATLDQTRAAARTAAANVAAAEQRLSLRREGFRAEDIAAAQGQLEGARAQLAGVRTDLEDTVLRAPTTGTILTRAAEPGAIVQPSEPIMTLAIDRPVRVRAYIPEPQLARISPGMEALVHVDGVDRVYRGTIGHISARAEFTPKTVETEDLRTDLVYRLRINIANPDDALRQGQPVTVEVPGARPPAED